LTSLERAASACELGNPGLTDVLVGTVDLTQMTGQTTKVSVPMSRDEVDLTRSGVGRTAGASDKSSTFRVPVCKPGESTGRTSDCGSTKLDTEIALQGLHLLLPDQGSGGSSNARATVTLSAAIGFVESKNVCDVLSSLDEAGDSVVKSCVGRRVVGCTPQHRDEVELVRVLGRGIGGIVVVPCPDLVSSNLHSPWYWVSYKSVSFVQIVSSAVVSLCTTTRPRLLEAVAATRGTATRSAEVVKRMAVYVINYKMVV
jgi:hypothetical protein